MKNTLSVFRSENKYLISVPEMSELTMKLDKFLKRDSNSINNSYIVRSLYFDSINNVDFQTKLDGEHTRKKIRIRVYDPNDKKCKLEMKQKNGDFQHKVSLWIDKEDAKSLIKCEYGVLKKYFADSSVAVNIYTTMCFGSYRPVVMVEYNRLAFMHELYNTRLTFDYNIRSSETNFDLFDTNIMFQYLTSNTVVLEVKYNEKLIGFISQLLKPYMLNRISISKYCLARKVFYDFNY